MKDPYSNPFFDKLHADKYRGRNETFREGMTRIASALADNDAHFHKMRNILQRRAFLPAGRIQAAAGSTRQITPYNCFVSGTIEDSFIEGHGSIMNQATRAASTMRLGGGIGYDFSTLRPRGTLIKKLNSHSSGPISFMGIFDAVCQAVVSAGHRRGAQMGVLRIDHPDIEEFIRAKNNSTSLTGFNISVAVTDAFMQAVKSGSEFPLTWGGQVYRHVKAAVLWDAIMASTYDYAEPGVLFIDTINRKNNLHYCETIAATNPCGEQPLPPHGACLLGSFNLTQYLKRVETENSWEFDFQQLYEDVPHVVRAMDNVVDRAIYPLFEQEKEAQSKRRMGLGVTGVANTIEALGYSYGSPGFIRMLEIILSNFRNISYRASVGLAREKGAFPLYSERYLDGVVPAGLPDDIYEDLRQYGIRNSHLLSIAPTGTISLCAGNVSSGVEPVFSYVTDRTIIEFDGPKVYRIEDYGSSVLGIKGKTFDQCSVQDHLNVLITASKYVDSAVSKTCNVPTDIPYDDFKQIYMRAWEEGCKGCTTFRPGGKRGGVLVQVDPDEAKPEVEAFSCSIDPLTGVKNCE